MKTFLIVVGLAAAAPVVAQEPPVAPNAKTPGKAAALSMLLPGLGHRYVNDGSWRGSASFFVFAEAGLWLGLAGAQWGRGQTIESYRTLAAGGASADLAGKDRRFLVNLGLYESSDAFREDHLRRRLWDQVNYVEDLSFQWHWSSDEDRQTYRRLRSEADAWSRRRTLIISTLALNRLLSAVTSLVAARRGNSAASPLSVVVAPNGAWPSVHFTLRL